MAKPNWSRLEQCQGVVRSHVLESYRKREREECDRSIVLLHNIDLRDPSSNFAELRQTIPNSLRSMYLPRRRNVSSRQSTDVLAFRNGIGLPRSGCTDLWSSSTYACLGSIRQEMQMSQAYIFRWKHTTKSRRPDTKLSLTVGGTQRPADSLH